MNIKRLNDEGRELWNQKSQFWDELHGDAGNLFHRRLVEPSVLQLLNLRTGEVILDIGCGNGALTRRLAERGGKVTAIDYSEGMLKAARARGLGPSGNIDYRVVDATRVNALLDLGVGRYDAVVCSMALMDIPTVEPIFQAAIQLLVPGGRFVFATMHPAFNSNNPIFIHEKEDSGGVVSDHFGLKIREYLDVPPVKGSGAPNEPAPHYYYHRSLSQLLGCAFAAGFVMDALLEPGFEPQDAEISEQLSWFKMWQIPPVLSGRLRLG